LQHAYNPVDWLPWEEKAFEKAKAEDKPILLSVDITGLEHDMIYRKKTLAPHRDKRLKIN